MAKLTLCREPVHDLLFHQQILARRHLNLRNHDAVVEERVKDRVIRLWTTFRWIVQYPFGFEHDLILPAIEYRHPRGVLIGGQTALVEQNVGGAGGFDDRPALAKHANRTNCAGGLTDAIGKSRATDDIFSIAFREA